MAWGTAYFGDEDRELTHEERVLRECHAYRRQVEFYHKGKWSYALILMIFHSSCPLPCECSTCVRHGLRPCAFCILQCFSTKFSITVRVIRVHQ